MNYIPTVKFRDESLETIIAGLEMDVVKNIVFDKFLPNIEYAIKRKKKTVIFCYVDEFQVVIKKEDFDNTLKIIEEYYVCKENFELCVKVKKLRDSL